MRVKIAALPFLQQAPEFIMVVGLIGKPLVREVYFRRYIDLRKHDFTMPLTSLCESKAYNIIGIRLTLSFFSLKWRPRPESNREPPT